MGNGRDALSRSGAVQASKRFIFKKTKDQFAPKLKGGVFAGRVDGDLSEVVIAPSRTVKKCSTGRSVF